MRNLHRHLLLLLTLTTGLRASDAYLPSPQTGNLIPVASVQWAEDFWFGDTPATLPGHLTQTTLAFEGEYGLAPDWAVDISSGFSWVNYQGGPLAGIGLIQDGKETRNGVTDTRVGISWRLVDEFRSVSEAAPTLTLRVGGIVRGTYDTGFINAVGDGASGWEAGLKFGKVFQSLNAGLYGDATYRWLNTSTPDEWEIGIGGFKTISNFNLFLGLREKHSVDGIDILGPGFTLDRFTDVKEVNRSIETGIGWSLGPQTWLSLGYARTLEGKNTPKKNVVLLSFSSAF